MKRFEEFAVLFVLASVSLSAVAQNVPSPAYKERGAYEVFSFGSSHDSAVGWTTEMDSGLGYDFSKIFSVQAGVPLYFVSATTTTSSGTGTTTTTSHYNSVGDAYLGLSLHQKSQSFGVATGLVGTVPTGNRANGISTGRPTITWANRAEKEFDRLTPFAEATLGNSLNSTQRFRRPFTTLGAVSTFTGGADIELFKGASFEASAYDVLPFGDQKMYSHVANQGASAGAGSPGASHRPFQTAAVTSGTSSLTKDHGFTGDLSFNPTRRVGVDFAYTRSIGYSLDSFGATVSFRLGHLPAPPASKN
jgi:hypothetical protein